MDATTVAVIAVPVFVVLVAVVFVSAARRRDTGEAIGMLSGETLARDRGPVKVGVRAGEETVEADGREIERAAALERRTGGALVAPDEPELAPYVPPDPDQVGVTRRQFLNRSIVNMMGLALAGFGAASLGFLWPIGSSGFGSRIRVGNLTDVIAEIRANNGFLYRPDGRMWITEYPVDALEKARSAYSAPELAGMESGVVALFQTCPHLGCRVPECVTSQWFECPCHGSQYNQVGEKKGGPAPRGMDRFAVEVSGGVLTVDTGNVIQGPPIGTNTTGQEAEGPHCLSDAGGGHG